MMKRLFALLLCLLMCLSCFCACASEEEELTEEEELERKGAIITMYLTDMIYDFDPAKAYYNEAAMKFMSLLYEPMFYLDSNGKVKSNLVKKYVIEEDEEIGEYKMYLYLADNTYWSDGTAISANDVVYSWKRVLEADASYAAAALLFDIKNARSANQGDASIDSIGLSAPDTKLIEVIFEQKIDYDQFLLNLTSCALAPLRENVASKSSYYTIEYSDGSEKIVRKYNDWAKKPATLVSSGAFKLRTIVYPDDPAVDVNGDYILGEDGSYRYCYYGIDASDTTGRVTVALTAGTRYEEVDGVKRVYTDVYLATLKSSDPERYAQLTSSLATIGSDASEYAEEPQNDPQIIIERNSYYFKNKDADNWAVDKIVKPYRIIINYSMTDEEIMAAYEAGEIFYVGDIPMSARSEYADAATITDALSTHAYYLNENAVIRYNYIEYDDAGLPILYDNAGKKCVFTGKGILSSVDANGKVISYSVDRDDDGNIIYYTADGAAVYSDATTAPILGETLLADVNVRNALSLVIDREAIANAVVFAEAASALVPTGVFNTNSVKTTFRDRGSDYISTTANLSAAQDLLSTAGVDASKFSIELSYAAYDEVHSYIAAAVAATWEELGFTVVLNSLETVENEDYWIATEEPLTDVKDDMWLEALVDGDYDVMAMDMVAISADPFSVLAPFATLFSGMGMNMQNFDEYGVQQYVPATHITGYSDETYDAIIEEAFAEKDIAARAEILHRAEEYLMTQMPVIPIVYNQYATLSNDKMLTSISGNYYSPTGFTKTYLKDTWQHDNHVKTVRNTIIIVAVAVIIVALASVLVIVSRVKKKKREEEIARISAEHEAKLREIRPGARRT